MKQVRLIKEYLNNNFNFQNEEDVDVLLSIIHHNFNNNKKIDVYLNTSNKDVTNEFLFSLSKLFNDTSFIKINSKSKNNIEMFLNNNDEYYLSVSVLKRQKNLDDIVNNFKEDDFINEYNNTLNCFDTKENIKLIVNYMNIVLRVLLYKNKLLKDNFGKIISNSYIMNSLLNSKTKTEIKNVLSMHLYVYEILYNYIIKE